MEEIKWHKTGFKDLKRLVDRRIDEERLAFCMEIETYIDEITNDHEWDTFFRPKAREYLNRIKKWVKAKKIIEGSFEDMEPKEEDGNENHKG